MKRELAGWVVIAALLSPAAAHAAEFVRGDLHIVDPYAREAPPGATTVAAYLTIDNRGRERDRLMSASSPRAVAVEIHAMREELGVMRMRQVSEVVVPPRQRVKLAPKSSLHLMIVEPTAPLRAGERVPVTLTFARAGPIDIEIPVEPMLPGEGMR
jgi:copper(I)-binding protein